MELSIRPHHSSSLSGNPSIFPPCQPPTPTTPTPTTPTPTTPTPTTPTPTTPTPTQTQTQTQTLTLSDLPSELLLQILSNLDTDIPTLLSLSRTTHTLRRLALDPLLHLHRLRRVPSLLTPLLTQRPPLSTLLNLRIYLTRTTLASRALSRNLIKIKLNRAISRRPSQSALVEKGVLPSETTYLAPSLIETKRRIEKERVKDMLRHRIEEWRSKRAALPDVAVEEGNGKPDVRRIARRFSTRVNGNGEGSSSRWGAGASRRGGEKEMPTRAKVLGLRRFWEKVGRDGITGGAHT